MEQSFCGRNSVIIVIFVLSLLNTGAGSAAAAEPLTLVRPPEVGFYFDAERDKYFSNEKSVFSIRPLEKLNYVDKIQVSVDGGEFRSYDGSLTFSHEGLHQIRFRAVDPVLNWSPVQTFRVYVDTTPPRSQAVWQGPAFTRDGTLYVNPQSKLTISSQDNLSGVAHVLWTYQNKTSRFLSGMAFPKEGKHLVKISAVDHVGNTETPYVLNFEVDATPPITSVKIEGSSFENGKKLFISTGSRVALSSQDRLSGVEKVEYKINEGPTTTYVNPIVISGNQVTLHYRGIDVVGNSEPWKSSQIHQDTRPPRIVISKLGDSVTVGGKIYARPGFKLQSQVTDEESGVKDILLSLDGKGFESTRSSEFAFSVPGEHEFHLKAVDQSGNFEESNPYNIVIDNQAPVSQLKTVRPLVPREAVFLSSVPNRIDFEAIDAGVGLHHVEISYDQPNSFRPLTSPIEVAEWKKDRQVLFYRSVDQLGNKEEPKKIEIWVRTTGPKVDLYVEAENLPNVPLSALRSPLSSSTRMPASENSKKSLDKMPKSKEITHGQER